MEQLNKGMLSQLNITHKEMDEKIIQFGEGNFLRAFVDDMVDELNVNGLFNGSIVVIQPLEGGIIDIVNEQDGLYTLLLRGIENGNPVSKKKIVTSISRGINPYKSYDDYMKCASNPSLRYVVSNTTEAGIEYVETDKLNDTPQTSFPGKVTAFLYKRFIHFSGDVDKGLVFIPCELIDNNGNELKKCVLKQAENWNLGQDFINWVNNSNIFTNTLVDRIVTGYPRDEISILESELGYQDKLLDTGEIFHFWVIECEKDLKDELPFHKLGLNVVWTSDATPYKQRKVRILNGAHTISVLAAFLTGKNTVLEMMEDEDFYKYLKIALYDEIIPTLDLDKSDLVSFADAVFDRFKNPYIKHFLLSIALNSVSKFKTRVLPSIIEYEKRMGELPKVLTFSMAALISFYKGTNIKNNKLIGMRNEEEYEISDSLELLNMFKCYWEKWELTEESTRKLVESILSKEFIWGRNLNSLNGFSESVSNHLYNILKNGMTNEVKELLC